MNRVVRSLLVEHIPSLLAHHSGWDQFRQVIRDAVSWDVAGGVISQ